MAIISKIKQYLKNRIVSAVQKVGDGVATLSVLSPKQLQEVEERRDKYLAEKPNMDGEETQSFIKKHIGAIGIEVYQAYLEQLDRIYSPVDANLDHFDEVNRIRFFDIKKWVTDTDEQSLDKLVNVYHVLSEETCNIALIYDRKKDVCNISIGVVNTDERFSDPAIADKYYERVVAAIQGNFLGADINGVNSIERDYGVGIPKCLERLDEEIENGKAKSIAIVSNVASEKSKDFISQRMEKLLDGIVPKDESEEYIIVLLAKPIKEQLQNKNRLYELYTALSPYSSWQTGYTYSEIDGISSSANFNVNLGISAGGSAVVNNSSTDNRSHTDSKGENTTKGVGFVGVYTKTHSIGDSDTIGNSVSQGTSGGYNASANFGISFSRSSSITAQIGKNETLSQTYTNYGVKHTLDIIESQIKRIEESSALGMWEFASYIISDSPIVANNVAHMYLALTQGEDSYITKSSINFWDGNIDVDTVRSILGNVQNLQHPVFGLKSSCEDEWLLYPTLVTPSTPLSGKELAKALNFPRKSVSGLPVLESASFGREINRFSNECNFKAEEIEIGNVYHMRKDEESKVSLDIESLSSHLFVTGSTGTGKSNAIYQIIHKLYNKGIHFLVIEPAKGEYKKVFGGNCKVYGTNVSKAELLRINPFSFPEGIHVLEHIDRLVEIFNACWPMYAAMPAILKDAIEKSYISVGWNLANSKCSPLVYPNFTDLMGILPEVISSSMYSTDTKSDYSGALITRIQSLTNGINGQILCSGRELSNEALFKNNVIIDLSRVGSVETKSLLMGILVMRLQEYRLDSEKMNEKLLHVTVIEEAHNLLRKTSFGQLQESANLQGKAVEMLTNSIAEMRTYGEGFIIADQAPALLDETVIRNTNTKIVLRLPDGEDRNLVGTSMALSENQIIELSKLPRGVAAVYQNDWVGAVLCHFEQYKEIKPYHYEYRDNSSILIQFLRRCFGIVDLYEIKEEDADIIRDWIYGLQNSLKTKNILFRGLEGQILTDEERAIVAYNVFEGKKLAKLLLGEKKNNKGIEKVDNQIRSFIGANDHDLIETIRRIVMQKLFALNEGGELTKRYQTEDLRRLK